MVAGANLDHTACAHNHVEMALQLKGDIVTPQLQPTEEGIAKGQRKKANRAIRIRAQVRRVLDISE